MVIFLIVFGTPVLDRGHNLFFLSCTSISWGWWNGKQCLWDWLDRICGTLFVHFSCTNRANIAQWVSLWTIIGVECYQWWCLCWKLRFTFAVLVLLIYRCVYIFWKSLSFPSFVVLVSFPFLVLVIMFILLHLLKIDCVILLFVALGSPMLPFFHLFFI